METTKEKADQSVPQKQRTTRRGYSLGNPHGVLSLASSVTNDSSLNNDPLSSSRDSGNENNIKVRQRKNERFLRSLDIEYPELKRSHSTKKYHYSKDYIKEELHEDESDSFCSGVSGRTKYSSYTIMPRDNLYFLDKKKLYQFEDSIIGKGLSTMEPVPETDDDNLIFQKPKMQILSDRKEDSKLKINIAPPIKDVIKKGPINEDDVIIEEKELDGIFDEYFDEKWDMIKSKYKKFYDKEEPPILACGLEGECKPFNDDVIDAIEEANFEDDAGEIIRKNSIKIQQKRKFADEIDKVKKGISKVKSIRLSELDKMEKPIDENEELEDNKENKDEEGDKEEVNQENNQGKDDKEKDEEEEEKDFSDEKNSDEGN